VAVLLAADDYPHLREEAEYQQAKAQLDASPELQRAYEEARSFHSHHPALVGIGPMPNDVRERILVALEKNAPLLDTPVHISLSPWTIRTQFAWAALLVLLLAAMAMLSSSVSSRQQKQRQQMVYNAQPPADAFRSFAGNLLSSSVPLQQMNTDTTQLVSWLADQNKEPIPLPPSLRNTEGIGCAYLDGPNGKISLVCLKVEGQILHLFITDSASLQLANARDPQPMRISGRNAIQWHDPEHAYLLLTHEPGDNLPEMFL
jgi:hypothetical protein